MTEWFEEWFGEEYLQLYPHRDDADAERAVALSERKDQAHLDVLGAAYAEVGEFDRAIRTADEALQLDPDGPSASAVRQHRAAYESRRPARH